MDRIEQTEEKLQKVSCELVEHSNREKILHYGMEEIEDYDSPEERLRKRMEWIEFRWGDGIKKRAKAEKYRPDLIKKYDDLIAKADEMFVRFFVAQMYDMDELQERWYQYEKYVLYPMAKVLSEVGSL